MQGPRSLELLEAVIDGPMPEKFNYFDMTKVTIAGQAVVIGRSGFTNELGWEFYMNARHRPRRGGRPHHVGRGCVWRHHHRRPACFRARRIEAGLLNAGSDFDETTTPFAAGLGDFVDFRQGRLHWAHRAPRRRPLVSNLGACEPLTVLPKLETRSPSMGRLVGSVRATAWSPYLQCGVSIVRMHSAQHGPSTEVSVRDSRRRGTASAVLVHYAFLRRRAPDPERETGRHSGGLLMYELKLEARKRALALTPPDRPSSRSCVPESTAVRSKLNTVLNVRDALVQEWYNSRSVLEVEGIEGASRHGARTVKP